MLPEGFSFHQFSIISIKIAKSEYDTVIKFKDLNICKSCHCLSINGVQRLDFFFASMLNTFYSVVFKIWVLRLIRL